MVLCDLLAHLYHAMSTGTLPETQKPNEHIKKLNISLKDDRRMRQLFRILISSDCTCKKAEDTVVRSAVALCFLFVSNLFFIKRNKKQIIQ